MSETWKTRGLVAVLCLAVLAGGCYGPFNLTQQVHHWNGTVSENEWAQEGLYLLLSFVFVYPLAIFGDAIIFNSIEFWGGANPIDSPYAAQVYQDGDVSEKLALR